MQEIGNFVLFMVFYGVLMVVIPAKLMGLPLLKTGAADSMAKALAVSHTVMISVVYLLALLHIYNIFSLVVGLAVAVGIYIAIRRKDFLRRAENTLEFTERLRKGQYKPGIIWKHGLRGWCGKICGWFGRLTPGKIACFIVFMISFVILLQRRLSPFLGNFSYMTSDMYVHNEWINYMEAGDIFYDGIYPFGMHNMISALHLLTGFHINRVMRYYGAWNAVLTVLAAIYYLKRVCKSYAAPVIYMVLYGATNFVGNIYAYRMIFTLPQECGMPFLFLSAWFLGRYLEKREKADGIYFACTFSTIISMHFFTAIFAAILCAGVGLTYICRIWKEKMVLPLFKVLILIVCISMLPFLGGKLEGKYWQGSTSWALSVIKDSMETTDDINADAEAVLRAEEEQLGTAEESGETEDYGTLRQVFYELIDSMYIFWGYVFWGGLAVMTLYLIFGKRDWRKKQLFAVWLTVVSCVLLICWQIIGIPQLVKAERVRMFFGYLAPVMLAAPFEMLAAAGKWGRRGADFCGIAAAGLCFWVTYGLGNIPAQSYFYLETSAAAEACVRISEEYEDGTWTVVSPVEELPLIQGQGLHYELWEFIAEMEQYDEQMELTIPTENVFFVVERQPVPYNEVRLFGETYADERLYQRDAKRVMTPRALGISESDYMKYYSVLENRRSLESKLLQWIKAYKKMFPDQVSVYMSSDNCVVYQLKQNVLALNNLAIDYGYNAKEQ